MTNTTDQPTDRSAAPPDRSDRIRPPGGPADHDNAGSAHHWTGVLVDDPWIAAARRLVPALAERAAIHDNEGSFVQEGIELVRDSGLLAMLVPGELGGGGATHPQACAVLAELAHGCPATSLTLSMHTHLVAAQRWRQRRGLPAPELHAVADGRTLLVSTGASDWLGSSGTARRVDDGFVVSARKQPASGCPAGQLMATSIRWDEGVEGPQVIHASVPLDAEGVSIERTWDTMGMRGTGSHTVVLEDVFVPQAAVALVRPADTWHPLWATVLGAALPLIMSSYFGVAEAAAAATIGIARGDDRPETVSVVGRMTTSLIAARDSVRAMIDSADDLRFDNTLEYASTVLARKTTATEACIATVRAAMELGGRAYSRSTGIERLFRDVQAATYHPLSAARQERFTGSVALGLTPH